MVKNLILPFTFMFLCVTALAQGDQENGAAEYKAPKPLIIEGYGEVYYGYDFNQPGTNNRPDFIYSHNRHNEVNINLVMLRAKYEKDRVRANIGIMTGTYANANLAAEPGVIKNIYEANGGVRLHKFRDLWLDAGIFESHIGPEGAISMDCPTLTRSLIAEGSPYYEAGARLSYTSINKKWYMAVMYLNGWQRIQRPVGYSKPAGGTQLTFTPNDKVLFNLSTFIGSDRPDIDKSTRYFADFYTRIQLAKKLQVTATIDIGGDTYLVHGTGNYDSDGWLGSALILQYNTTARASWVARGEYFYDPFGTVMPTVVGGITPEFAIAAYSLGYDRRITNGLLWRIEAKGYVGNDRSFRKGAGIFNDDYVLTTSLAFRFNNRKNH